MTIRRSVSLYIQEIIMDAFDGFNNDGKYAEDDFHFSGEAHPDVPDDIPYVIEYSVFQERPNTFTHIVAYSGEELFWSQGYSKCIGVHKDKPPDKWDAREGVRLAQARAATKIGEKIDKYENFEEEE